MRVHHGMLGKSPTHGDGRSRSYLANEELGARATTVHENVLSPGAVVPSAFTENHGASNGLT